MERCRTGRRAESEGRRLVAVEVIDIDHIFVAVRDLRGSEEFYDRDMGVSGFRKREKPVSDAPTFSTTIATSCTR